MRARILQILTLLIYGIFAITFIGCALQSPKGLKYYPQNKDELFSLARDNNIYLGDIDTSKITDMSYLFANIENYLCNEFAFEYEYNKEDFIHFKVGEYNMSYKETLKFIEGILKACKYPKREDFSGIESWDTYNTTDMSYMFFNAKFFNQDINSWNVSKVKNMRYMFAFAKSFNKSLGLWDTSNVENMERMFYIATSFNQPLNSWDISKVKDMSGMFKSAKSFNQNLESWGDKLNKECDVVFMFDYSPLESNPPKWHKERMKNKTIIRLTPTKEE